MCTDFCTQPGIRMRALLPIIALSFAAACGTTAEVPFIGETDTAPDSTADAGEPDGSEPDATADVTADADEDSTDPDAPSVDVGLDPGDVPPDEGPEPDVAPDGTPDAATCLDGESTSAEVFCEDGTIGNIVCTCAGGVWECSPDPCESSTLPCSSDSECSPLDHCEDCATSSCPDCDDCVAGCLPHGCPTERAPTCRMLRPDCSSGEVAVVDDGCWVCVNRRTCLPAEPPTSDCEDAGAACFAAPVCPGRTDRIRSSCEPTGGICCQGDMGFCDDGSEVLCDMVEPRCDAFEVVAVIEGCYQCVNPSTCAPWGVAGCESDRDCPRGQVCDECASGSCPFCEDCVAGCVPR